MRSWTLIHVLAVVTVALGVFMIVRAVAEGGGIGSYGVLVGAFFVAAGVLRLRLLAGRARAAGAAVDPPAEPQERR